MPSVSFIRKPEVLQICGFSSSTLYRLINKKVFPASFVLGVVGHSRSVAWRKEEIDAWVASRPRTSISKLEQDHKEK